MGIFVDVIADKSGNIVDNRWLEWDHFYIPNKPQWLRKIMRNIMAFLGHCMVCTSIDGCYFLLRKMPEQPQHEKCDCKKKSISTGLVKSKAHAELSIEKFTNYIFSDKGLKNGKQKIFRDWGYSINDSFVLQKTYEEQALNEYLNGNYMLKNLDRNGQRISIETNLNGNIFYSGWILEPEGKIRNTTPFGGWLK